MIGFSLLKPKGMVRRLAPSAALCRLNVVSWSAGRVLPASRQPATNPPRSAAAMHIWLLQLAQPHACRAVLCSETSAALTLLRPLSGVLNFMIALGATAAAFGAYGEADAVHSTCWWGLPVQLHGSALCGGPSVLRLL